MEITTELSIESHLLDLIEEWKSDLFDLNFKDADGWSDANRALASAQYAYIKFGLTLEKIRNECAYKYCEDKLKTFAQFCRQKLKLTVWQANSYIEAADTAMYLADSGFEILPKNYSQAAVLTKAKKLETGYYQDHPMLEQIWGTLVANTASEKITANAIEKAIDPDYDEKQSLRLPKRLLTRAKIQARLRGITVEAYLDELMNADADEGCIVDPDVASQVTPEMSQIIDELELQWLEPKSAQIITTPISTFGEQPSFFWISIAAFISRLRTNPQRVSP
jgi:predicted DNA binding CopG/RHH family protein